MKENSKEDIKNIEEIIELSKKEIDAKDENMTAILDIEDLISLKHILSDYKRVLEINEVLLKENEELKNKIMEKELEIIGKEEYTKASMGEIIEQYYTANEECIPVQKVKDKIEELKEKSGGNVFHIQQTINAEIRLLKELLEESEKEHDGK